jgi:hypothetical protein
MNEWSAKDMIDDEKEARDLIEALNGHLPMRAYATLPLVKAVRQDGANINVNDAVQIDSLLYLGDEGGIACAIELTGGKTVVITSITHLRMERDHPLANRVHAYQTRRAQRLGRKAHRGQRSTRSTRAAKRGRK